MKKYAAVVGVAVVGVPARSTEKQTMKTYSACLDRHAMMADLAVRTRENCEKKQGPPPVLFECLFAQFCRFSDRYDQR